MAFAMFSTAMLRKPSATCSSVRSAPVAARISPASCSKRLRTTATSSACVAVRSEHLREELRLQLPEHDIAIGHGQRTAAAITSGTRIRACGIGTDAITAAVEVQNGAAARGHRVYAHHRRAHAHARDLRLECPLELAGEVRDIGRRAAHVESDDALESGGAGGSHGADHTARRP